MSSRSTVTEEIRAALAADARIVHAADVAAAEREGTVTLRGTVRSLHQRRTAVEMAVEDGLRVDPRDRALDNELRGAALQALAHHGVPARVDVDVSNGWATRRARSGTSMRATARSPPSPASRGSAGSRTGSSSSVPHRRLRRRAPWTTPS